MESYRLEMLKQIAAALASQFGSNCEVVVHDLSAQNTEHPIVHIENGHVTRKVKPDQPQRLVNVVRCTNPRCITAIEEGCDHIFALTPSGKYRCIYCEQEFTANLNGENVRLVKK